MYSTTSAYIRPKNIIQTVHDGILCRIKCFEQAMRFRHIVVPLNSNKENSKEPFALPSTKSTSSRLALIVSRLFIKTCCLPNKNHTIRYMQIFDLCVVSVANGCRNNLPWPGQFDRILFKTSCLTHTCMTICPCYRQQLCVPNFNLRAVSRQNGEVINTVVRISLTMFICITLISIGNWYFIPRTMLTL